MLDAMFDVMCASLLTPSVKSLLIMSGITSRVMGRVIHDVSSKVLLCVICNAISDVIYDIRCDVRYEIMPNVISDVICDGRCNFSWIVRSYVV